MKCAAKAPACVTMYHASLSDETKEAIYSKFVSGNLCCVVSTIAFGMVRFSSVVCIGVCAWNSNVYVYT